jgi:menaquinone-specific isochorismate synthase
LWIRYVYLFCISWNTISDSANPADIFDLASKLHPSAAVCGTPRDLAKKAIDEIEGISRGRYAGPVGWIDSKGDGELALALRCGQITSDGKSIRIYAGCGIVAGSDPEREYAESQAKLLQMRIDCRSQFTIRLVP